ncbi:MAG: DUF6798 domain-containing protein [Bacteroidota bacterium]
MNYQQKNERIDFVLFSLCVALCYLLLHGYSFNSGDLSEHLPQVYRHFNSALYPHDFFLTYYDQQFTVREAWVKTVTALSAVMPVQVVCFSLHLLCFTLTVLAWMRIARVFSAAVYAPYIAALCIFLLFQSLTVGGNTLMGNAFYSSIPAEMLASWAVYAMLHKRVVWSAVLCGVALWFQAIVGLQMSLLLGAVAVFDKHTWRRAGMFVAVFVPVASPVLVPLLSTYALSCPTCDTSLYYTVLYQYRAFLHYLPHLFPVQQYVLFLAMLLPAAYVAYARKHTFKPLLVMCATALACCVVYTVLIYTVWPGSGMLQAFKTTVWINACCGVAVSVYVAEKIPEQLNGLVQRFRVAMGVCAVLLFVVLTHAAYLPVEKLRSRYQIGTYEHTDLQRMHEWIRLNTPVDAMCIADPSDDSFSCEAQRSMPVNYKAVVHDKKYMLMWWERMKLFYGVDEKQMAHSTAIEQAIRQYSQHYIPAIAAQCRYALFRNTVSDSLLHRYGKKINTTNDWILLELNTH